MDSAEHIRQPRTPGVVLCRNGPELLPEGHKDRIEGELWLNAHHFIFAAGETIYQELHTNVFRLDTKPAPSQGKIVTITLHSLRQLHLWFSVDSHADNAINAIKYLARPSRPDDLFATQRGNDADPEPGVGWRLFDEKEEFARLGVQMDPSCDDKGEFKITRINEKFKLCSSYPKILAVPATIEDAVLKVVATYRDGGRLPVLSYLRTSTVLVNGEETVVKTPLMRSAQPLVTSSSKRKYEDEQYLRNVQQIALSKEGKIFDTRSISTISSHTRRGGGWELIEKYYKWTRIPSDIPAFSQLQESLDKLLEASMDDTMAMNQFLGKIDPWLSHVRGVLSTAVVASYQVENEQVAVLVHGSSGCDNTATIVSLAQVFLDPHFRTLRGFCQLIEKEWLRMGHPFADRIGQVGPVKSVTRAPSFLLFLDSVQQVLHQYPPAFEFTEAFLRELHHHTISSDYGTFLYNSLAEREAAKLETKASSLWTYLLAPEQRVRFSNPIYEPEMYPGWIRVSFKSQALRLWKEMFCWRTYDADAPMARLTMEVQQARQADEAVTAELQAVMAEIAQLEAAS